MLKPVNEKIIKIEYENTGETVFLNNVDLRTVNNIFYISCQIKIDSRIVKFNKIRYPKFQMISILIFSLQYDY